MRALRWKAWWLALWLLGVALITLGSLVPPQALPPSPPVSDKLLHALGYFVLGCGAVALFRRRLLLRVAAGLVAFGFAIELAQGGLTAQRTFEWADVAANAVGVLASLVLAPTPLANALVTFERWLASWRAPA